MGKGNSVGSAGGSTCPHGDDSPGMLARAEVDSVHPGAAMQTCRVYHPGSRRRRKDKRGGPPGRPQGPARVADKPQNGSPAPVPHNRGGTEYVHPAKVTPPFTKPGRD